MAFQIKDDLFDLLGNENDTGKNNGGDVKKLFQLYLCEIGVDNFIGVLFSYRKFVKSLPFFFLNW